LISLEVSAITIACASNFKTTLVKIVNHFEGPNNQHQIKIVSGSSGMLHTQITQGAPFDIFLSADEARPILLEEKLDIESFIYAKGRLVFWQNNATVVNKESFSNFSGKIAIANPRLAPYGFAAREFLAKYKPGHLAVDKLIRGNNVNQNYHFIQSGNVDAGFVSLTQMILGKHKNYWLIPTKDYPPIIQRGIVINSSDPTTTEFVTFLGSDIAQTIIQNSGYDVSNELGHYLNDESTLVKRFEESD
jgi:molybdate transport system substrate-binding protein